MIRHQLLPLFKSCIHTSNNSKSHCNLNGLMTTTELSPAAQAILDVWENEWSKASLCHDQHSIAAVLRTAADYLEQSFPWPYEYEGAGVDWAVSKLQDIADELEGAS